MKKVLNNKSLQVFLASFLFNYSNLLASDEINSFNPDLTTYNCVSTTSKEDSQCSNNSTKKTLLFSEINLDEPANIITKIAYENEDGLLYLSLFIDKGFRSLMAEDDYEEVTLNVTKEGELYGALMKKKIIETGLTFLGEWKLDEKGSYIRFGQGKLISKSGDVFEGVFDDEKAVGKILYPDGAFYEGEIDSESGSYNGKGKFYYANGSISDGNFKNGEAHGETIFTGKGFKYEGTVLDNKYHGIGKYIYPDGSVYEGTYNEGKMHGYGKFTYPPDNNFYSKYEGEYKNGKVTGIGNYYDPLGRLVYSGRLLKATKNGFGMDTFYTQDGGQLTYIGEQIDDQYNGKGKLIFSDGSYYEGDFIAGKLTGRGEFHKLEKIYYGYFLDGELEGRGKVFYKLLDLEVESNFIDGLEEGDGIATYRTSGEKFGVSFKAGLYQGDSDVFPTEFSSGKRLALVVGNNDYLIGKLNYAVNDSFAMVEALQAKGFEVIHIINADKKTFLKGIENFRNLIYQYGTSATALFYYSGHAAQIDGSNYLYPVDAKVKSKADIEIDTINMARVFSAINSSLRGVKIVILDACRDNPYSVFSKTTTKGLATSISSSGTIIGYSTGPGETAVDGGKGQLSFYTASLVDQINKPGIDIEDVFKYTSRSVATETNDLQIPWYSSSLLVDFYFQKEK